LQFNTQQRWRDLSAVQLGDRAICDYIAGMTDEYAERMYQRLFGRG
jgi:dGTPase